MIRYSDKKYTVLKSAHHSISDGWSSPILLKHVHDVYHQLLLDRPAPVKVDNAYLDAQRYCAKHQASVDRVWQQKIKTIAHANDLGCLLTAQVDLDQVRVIQEPKQEALVIEGVLYQAMSAISREHGVTLNILLQFAWHKLIQVYTRDEQTIVGATVSGRALPIDGIENSVGLFINTLPLVVGWAKDLSVIDQLKKIHHSIIELNSHSYAHLAKLQQQGQRLFHSLLIFENYPLLESSTLEERVLQGHPGKLSPQFCKAIDKVDYPLSVVAYERQGALQLKLDYAGEYVSEQQAKRILAQMVIILGQLKGGLDRGVNDITLLAPEEYQRIIFDWNKTNAPYPSDKTIHQLFEEQVIETPNNIAIVFEDQQLTYAQLNRRANQLARHIRRQYEAACAEKRLSGEFIALFVDASTEMIVAILAVLKVGGAYVPIDPSYPASRVKYILDDAECKILLTCGTVYSKALDFCKTSEVSSCPILIDIHDCLSRAEIDSNLDLRFSPDDLSYLIYTSGTTGAPKGVMGKHQGVVNLVSFLIAQYEMTENERIPLFANYIFDASIEEIFLALLSGSTLYIPQARCIKDPSMYLNYIRDNEIGHLQATPSYLSQIDPSMLPRLNRVVFGAEFLHESLFNHYHRYVSSVINTFGPTEVAITSVASFDSSKIGKAIQNTHAYVLDQYLNPVPIGVIGELHLGGAGITRGYLNRPELTKERFISNPFATEQDTRDGYTRLYKTGDLVRWLPDGNLEYIGRNDFQVKIRGYRIELGEIENTLSKIESIKQTVVLAKDRQTDAGVSRYLVAYYVADRLIDTSDLVSQLSEQLPEYMVPTFFMQVDTLPLTATGKLDRRALPDVELNSDEHQYAVPRNEIECEFCSVWQKLLGVERVGIHDDFFRLGGDSILSIQLTSRLRAKNYSCSIKDIFEHRTIARLVQHLRQRHEQAEINTEQGVLTGTFGLLPIQSWFFERQLPVQQHWNQSFLVSVPELECDRLERVLPELVAHHDVLRLHYNLVSNEAVTQCYQSEIEVPTLKVIDRSALSDQQLQQRLTEWQSSFDIETGPLWQLGYISGYPDQSARLYVEMHHLIIDAVSWRILIDDIQQLYAGHTLGEKTSSYRQWVSTVKAYASNHADELDYWKQQIQCQDNDAILALQGDKQVAHHVELTVAQTSALLQQAPQAYHTEINDLLLTALAYSLQQLGLDVPVITLEGHGREPIDAKIDVSRTVGWFTTAFPVKLELQSCLEDSIKTIKEHLRAIPNKGIGYGALKQYANDSALREHTLPGISFNYLGQLSHQDGFWQVSAESSGRSSAAENKDHHLININGSVNAGRLRFVVVSCLNKESAQHFSQYFQKQLVNITEHCLSHFKEVGCVYTPSGFPTVDLSQKHLDVLQARYDIESIYPANSLQQGFIYHALHHPEDDAYRVQSLIEYHTALDLEQYCKAWQYAVDTFPMLRTCFDWDEALIQIVNISSSLYWEIHDIREYSDKEQAIEAIQQVDRAKPYDFTQPQLLRIIMIRHSDKRYILLKSAHHIITDGWSGRVLLKYVHDTYKKLLLGQAVSVTVDNAYLAAQDYFAKHQIAVDQFWQQNVKTVEHANDLGCFFTKPIDLDQVTTVKEPQCETLVIEGALYQSMKTISSQNATTLNVLIQFAWHKLIQVYTRDEQTVVGTTVSGRALPIKGVENSVGLFINTLPLILDWSKDISIGDQLREIHDRIVAVNSHSYAQLSSLQAQGQRLFHSILIFQNMPDLEESALQSKQDELSPQFRKSTGHVNYPFSIIVFEHKDALHLKLGYAGEYISEQQVKRILSQITIILGQLKEGMNSSVNEITLLSPEEYHKTVFDWNKTDKQYPSRKTIHQLFEAQVEKTPNNVAVVFENQQMTYQQLNESANQLARHISYQHREIYNQDLAVGAFVALFFNRSIEMIVAILAVLKTGGAYVPIDPDCSDNRMEYMLTATQCKIVLTQSYFSEKLVALSKKIIENKSHVVRDQNKVSHAVGGAACQYPFWFIDIDSCPFRGEESGNLNLKAEYEDLSCLLYTSGTTGEPKGVMCKHQGVVNLTTYLIDVLSITQDENISLFANYAFDVSSYQIGIALLSGNKLFIPSSECIQDPAQYLEFIKNNNITYVEATPSYLSQVDPSELSMLKRVVFVAEYLSEQFFNRFSFHVDQIANIYGPTETAACFVSVNSSTIGKPIQNTRAYVLDQYLMPVSIGIIGELYVGGAGLAEGYYNKAELTAERFIQNQFATEQDLDKGYTRLYKTGDLVRWLPGGNLEYIGRNDFQIKIRGFRVELGDIENNLSDFPGINQVIVICETDSLDALENKYLIAYYLGEEGIAKEQLIEHLKDNLPDYMIPNVFVRMASFPLTINGKLDRKALPKVALKGGSEDYVAPRSELERQCCQVWQELFNLKAVGIKDDFFELGGNSILSIHMVTKIEKLIHRKVPIKALFSFRTIEKLVESLSDSKDNHDQVIQERKPLLVRSKLPHDILQQLIAYTAGWHGKRLTPHSLIFGFNVNGKKTPLFWCLQGFNELSQLAKHMGEDQPVYGMRSLNAIPKGYAKGNAGVLASDYACEIESIMKGDECFLGGNCQSSYIAIQIANNLVKQGKKIRLLCLLEHGEPVGYLGKTLLLYGMGSEMNPYMRFKDPQLGLKKLYPAGFSLQLTAGSHGQYFQTKNVKFMTAILKEELNTVAGSDKYKVIDGAFHQMGNGGMYHAELACQLPESLPRKSQMSITVSVKNISDVTWLETEYSGIRLANRWLDAEGEVISWIDGRSDLTQKVNPGDEVELQLNIQTPKESGRYVLELDMVEEGVAWFQEKDSSAKAIVVEVRSRILSSVSKIWG